MAVLVLDLDLTLFITEDDEPRIDLDSHVKDHHWLEAKAICEGEIYLYKIAFLNPIKLAGLLEHACENDHKIMILTAGFWDKDSVQYILANHLSLSEAARDKIYACDFLSPGNSIDQFEDQSCSDIQCMSKNDRLKQFVSLHPELSDEQFVVIDDSIGHIQSFKTNQKVHAIHATTDKDFIAFTKQFDPSFDPTSFYDFAKQTLDRLSIPRVEFNDSIRTGFFGFFAHSSARAFNKPASATPTLSP